MSSGQHGALCWRKSSKSYSNGQCVEVARVGLDTEVAHIGVRDSNDVGLTLTFTQRRWRSFVGELKLGAFDR
ncbi:MAG: DUF397 domain-containing protein [Streptosporangiaceae bacterium]